MEPKRLLDDHRHAAAQRLIRAARREAPPEGASKRLSVALCASAATVSTAAGAAASGTAGTSGAATLQLLPLAKWLLGGVLLGGGVVTAVQVAHVPPEPTRPATMMAPSAVSAVSTVLPAAPSSAGSAPVQPSAPAAAPPPAAPSSRPWSAAPRSLSSAGSPADDTLATVPAGEAEGAVDLPVPPSALRDPLLVELESLDAARRSLASGQAGNALAELDAYERAHPGGKLAPEALVLRIRALVQLGRREEARAIARPYLERTPRASHAEQIRALVGLDEGDDQTGRRRE